MLESVILFTRHLLSTSTSFINNRLLQMIPWCYHLSHPTGGNPDKQFNARILMKNSDLLFRRGKKEQERFFFFLIQVYCGGKDNTKYILK